MTFNDLNEEAAFYDMLGGVYLSRNDPRRAVECYEQCLAIARKLSNRLKEGEALGNLGNAHMALEEYGQAGDYYQQCLTIAREIKDSRIEAASLKNIRITANRLQDLSKAQLEAKQPEDVFKSARLALELYQTVSNKAGVAGALLNLASAHRAVGDAPQAISYYEQSLTAAREAGNGWLSWAALHNLSVICREVWALDRGLECLQQMVALAREEKDRARELQALRGLGDAYLRLKNFDEAIKHFRQCLAIAAEDEHREALPVVLNDLGNAYLGARRHQEALDAYNQCLTLSRKMGSRPGEGIALGGLGSIYFDQGEYARAIECQEQSLAIARELNDRENEGKILGNLGATYRALGDDRQGLQCLEDSLVLAQQCNDLHAERLALRHLTPKYLLFGHYAKALSLDRRRLEINRQLKDRRDEARVLDHIGIIHFYMGEYERALVFHTQSLKIFEELNDRAGQGEVLGAIGDLYRAGGAYKESIEYHEQHLAIAREVGDRREEGEALGAIGDAYCLMGEGAKAVTYHRQRLEIAREVGSKFSERSALGGLGSDYYILGDYEKAIEYQLLCLEKAREINDPEAEGGGLHNLALCYLETGDPVTAEKRIWEGIRVWESLRGSVGDVDDYKVSLFNKQSNMYQTLERILVAQQRPEAALEIAERGRARALFELMAARSKSARPEQWVGEPPDLKVIQRIANEQNATLVEYSIITGNFREQGRAEGRDSELYVWVVRPDGAVSFRQVDLKPLWQQQNTTLAKIILDTRAFMGVNDAATEDAGPTKDSRSTEQSLRLLYDLLIEPIHDLLPREQGARVIIIPRGPLFLVPFAALLNAAGLYLIEQYSLVTSPSIHALDLTHNRRREVRGQAVGRMVVGDPVMPAFPAEGGGPSVKPKPLPHARIEAIEIANYLQTRALTGAQATKRKIVQDMHQQQIIHFATHAMLDDFYGIGIPGAIILSASEGDNGVLSAEEILNLELKAELVVLSACNTGKGRVTGDGVIGLSRAFILAGVPSIIVSLWAVLDESTKFLMVEFYKQLRGGTDKAAALRQAMLATLSHPKYKEPLHWAAFFLVGEAE